MHRVGTGMTALTFEPSKAAELLWKSCMRQHVTVQAQHDEMLAVAQAWRQLSQRVFSQIQPAIRTMPVVTHEVCNDEQELVRFQNHP